MKTGIPISGDDLIELEVGGITYLLRPAIGPIENKIQSIQSSIYDIRGNFAAASKRIDEQNPGREWKSGERIKAIQDMAQNMAEEQFWTNYSAENENQRRDEIFDCICAGWKGNCYKLKEKDNPSAHVPGSVKRHIVDWYTKTQLQLSGEEIKNS